MISFPFFFNMDAKQCAIIGGGDAAFIKACATVKCDVQTLVIAPVISEKIKKLPVIYTEKKYEFSDIIGAAFVITATDDKLLNEKIHSDARKEHIPVCRADNGKQGDFIIPSIKKQGDITIAVSTNGKYPKLAKKIARTVDLRSADKLDIIENLRKKILINVHNKECREQLLNMLIEDEFLYGGKDKYEEKMNAVLGEYLK